MSNNQPKRRRVDLSRGAEAVDLSRGAEAVPVLLVDDVPPPEARYIKQCESADGRVRDAELAGCECKGCCSNESSCCCLGGRACAYDDDGRLRALLDVSQTAVDLVFVIECTDQCACSVDACRNRVVSRGLKYALQVYCSPNRGLAVRTEVQIQCGAFVCEYAGELISSADAATRRRQRGHDADNYIMTLREHLPNGRVICTTIDPTEKGNVGRYINHSCVPNLRAFPVRAGSLIPRVGLFAVREIKAQEELTMFYGDAGARAGSTPCLCGEVGCLGFLPCDDADS
eukprot:156808-Prymnesium_polylepis.1